MSKLIYGVGVNDADYNVSWVDGERAVCPFYSRWVGMLRRAYSAKTHQVRPTYKTCSVHPDWHVFSSFKSWMECQDWEGKHLDKDILFEGNKKYSPDTCVFITVDTNSFITDRAGRGDFPMGVHKFGGRFRAMVNGRGKAICLGMYSTPEEAHQSWREAKYKLAVQLSSEQTDPRVAAALIERYKL